jgi:hypothetical protein
MFGCLVDLEFVSFDARRVEMVCGLDGEEGFAWFW